MRKTDFSLMTLLLLLHLASVSAADNFDIESAIKTWESKSISATGEFFLNECDFALQLSAHRSCDPKRRILFRGDGKKRQNFNLSKLLLNRFLGGSFSNNQDSQEQLRDLKNALSILRPLVKIPKENDEIVFLRGETRKNSQWVHRFDVDQENEELTRRLYGHQESPQSHLKKAKKSELSFRQILFLAHKDGELLDFKDPKLGIVSLDPLISFSSNPRIALQFAKESFQNNSAVHPNIKYIPHMIVISVPESKFEVDCGETLLVPGLLLNPKSCGQFKDYGEMEYSAELKLDDEDIIGSFEVPTSLIPR